MSAPKKGSRGHKSRQSRNTSQGRDGQIRNNSKVAKSNPARKTAEERGETDNWRDTGHQIRQQGRPKPPKHRPANLKGGKSARQRQGLPQLKRVQLPTCPPDKVFSDRDGEKYTFADSNLKRLAASILSDKRKAWRYRPFDFPLFNDKGHEQSFHFDFYIYDAEDSVIRLILVLPFESREVWDKIGRFKRQYPMYMYELWTPEKLYQLGRPKAKLGF